MLRLHKLRAFLTMLGVIIGVMSVTLIIMISSGFQAFMSDQFQKLGSDTIMVMFDNWGNRTDRVSSLEVATPIYQVSGQKVSNGDKLVDNPRIYASDENFGPLNRIVL